MTNQNYRALNDEASRLHDELSKLNDNARYWTLYHDYKKLYENFYARFFAKKKQGLTFEKCFLAFSEIRIPSCEAEIDAYKAIRTNLNF